MTVLGQLLGVRHPPDTTKAGQQPGFDAKRGTCRDQVLIQNPEGFTAAIVATQRAHVNGDSSRRSVIMRKLDSSVPHRLGRRTNFIPALEGRPAKWAEVIDSTADLGASAVLAKAAVAAILIADDDGAPTVETADVNVLKRLVPDQLFAVRRPVSHQGMTNYILRVCVPSAHHDARAVWCESFNEMSHLRDLLLTTRPTQVSTQPMRLEWVFASGVRSHVPDFLVRTANGGMTLVDVTTERKFDDPKVRAIMQLTGATAKALGWTYQVRTELPPQRIRNVNFIHASGHDIRHDQPSAARTLRQATGPVDVERARGLLGGSATGYMRLWDLLAHGLAHIPLDGPIERDTPVTTTPSMGGSSWLHAL